MPKNPIKYCCTILYKLCCKDLNIKDIYVGHTTNFTRRKYDHKNSCSTKEIKVYQFIRDNGGWDNWEMIEIEKCSFNDSNEARARERYWIETLNSSLNCNIPLRTNKEYVDTHKDQRKETSRRYFQNKMVYPCEVCGKSQSTNISRHNKSKFHLSKLNLTD